MIPFLKIRIMACFFRKYILFRLQYHRMPQGRDWVNNAKAGVEAAISRTREGSRLRKKRLAALGFRAGVEAALSRTREGCRLRKKRMCAGAR